MEPPKNYYEASAVSYTAAHAQSIKCHHANGWFVTVAVFIFSKRVFVCSDCGAVVEKQR